MRKVKMAFSVLAGVLAVTSLYALLGGCRELPEPVPPEGMPDTPSSAAASGKTSPSAVDLLVCTSGFVMQPGDIWIDSANGPSALSIEDTGNGFKVTLASYGTWAFVGVAYAPGEPSTGYNLTGYTYLHFKIRGDGTIPDNVIKVGMKDTTDPNNGSETKIGLTGITDQWKTFEIPISSFATLDPNYVKIFAEFVIEEPGHQGLVFYFDEVGFVK